jgi:hypothetical protein
MVRKRGSSKKLSCDSSVAGIGENAAYGRGDCGIPDGFCRVK